MQEGIRGGRRDMEGRMEDGLKKGGVKGGDRTG